MRFSSQKHTVLSVALLLSVLLATSNQEAWARPQASAASRAGAGPAGSSSASSASADASAGGSGSSSSSSASASTSASSGSGGSGSGSSSSPDASSSAQASSSSGSSSPASSSSSASGDSSASAQASASANQESTTPKPEGLFDRMKDVIKGGRDMVKNSVDSLTKSDDKKPDSSNSASANAGASSSGGQASASAQASASGGGFSDSSNSQKSEGGLLDKIGDRAKKIFGDKKDDDAESRSDKKNDLGSYRGGSSSNDDKSLGLSRSGDDKGSSKSGGDDKKDQGSSKSGGDDKGTPRSSGDDKKDQGSSKSSGDDKGTLRSSGDDKGTPRSSGDDKKDQGSSKSGGDDKKDAGPAKTGTDDKGSGRTAWEELKKDTGASKSSGDDKGTARSSGDDKKDQGSSKSSGDDKGTPRSSGDDKKDQGSSKSGGDDKGSSRNFLDNKEGPVDKMTKLVSKGTDAVRNTFHKIEDKSREVGERVTKMVDDNITKPMQNTSGSGQLQSQGHQTPEAKAVSELRGSERDKYLNNLKKKQESDIPRANSLKEIVSDAKSRGVIPRDEDRSVLNGNHDDEKSIAVEVLDKAHELSKIPFETVLRPLDKMLGYEKDPSLRIYDNSYELLRKPVEILAKPVESVFTGAFKTTDETKVDNEKLLATSSETERKDARASMEKAKKADRSVTGSIADKNYELATKPMEIVLKPIDHMLGLDKDGKKNPLLNILDQIYGMSKTPVDRVAKPFETMLRKMGDGEQAYQVSLRYAGDDTDPKLVTRLADGALNIADRVMTKPLEIVLKPLDHMLGFDEAGKKNPILEAAHSLKNATKLGMELWTKPMDRIIKEISDIGEEMTYEEREVEMQRQREEASRIVKAMDKLKDAAQMPFEIVLRPVTRALGINKENKKEGFLRAWDIMYQVARTPVQVISKPVEDVIFGEKPRRANGARRPKHSGEHHKNIVTDSIKRVEKIAMKPLDVVTSPIRRLILGEDNEKVGSITEKSNRQVQAKAKSSGGSGGSTATSQGKGGKQADKIVVTLEKMNNVMLKPLEEVTQTLSDLLSPQPKQDNNSSNKVEVKTQSKTQSNGQSKTEAKVEVKTNGKTAESKSVAKTDANGKSEAKSYAKSEIKDGRSESFAEAKARS